MILHIGDNEAVLARDIIMILDAGIRTKALCNKSLIAEIKEAKKLYGDINTAKSLVFVSEEGQTRIYCSDIKAVTLMKRAMLH